MPVVLSRERVAWLADRARGRFRPAASLSATKPGLGFEHACGGGTWQDPEVGRPIAAPLGQCAALRGVDLATARRLAARVATYDRPDGTPV
jgi:hypothetical protein